MPSPTRIIIAACALLAALLIVSAAQERRWDKNFTIGYPPDAVAAAAWRGFDAQGAAACAANGMLDLDAPVDRLAIALTAVESHARPGWVQGLERAMMTVANLAGLDLDLSIGPAQMRPSTLRAAQARDIASTAIAESDLYALCPSLVAVRDVLAGAIDGAAFETPDGPALWRLYDSLDLEKEVIGALDAYMGAAGGKKTFGGQVYRDAVFSLWFGTEWCPPADGIGPRVPAAYVCPEQNA